MMIDLSSEKPCRLQTLAANTMGCIQRCRDCGCISVHLAAVTLRFDHSGLESLGWMVEQARAQLAARQLADLAAPQGSA